MTVATALLESHNFGTTGVVSDDETACIPDEPSRTSPPHDLARSPGT